MTIGDSFTEEREDFLDKKYFELKEIWKKIEMNNEEKLWMVLNFLYEPVIDAHYDHKADRVDTTLAHMELDKIVKDMSETIDSSNARLHINPDYKK